MPLPENGVPLWQTWHLFKLQDQAQSNHGLVDVAALGSRIHLCRYMAPSFTLAAFGRQMPFHQLAESASVVRVITVGIFNGRGSFRDQFGRAKTRYSSRTQHFK